MFLASSKSCLRHHLEGGHGKPLQMPSVTGSVTLARSDVYFVSWARVYAPLGKNTQLLVWLLMARRTCLWARSPCLPPASCVSTLLLDTVSLISAEKQLGMQVQCRLLRELSKLALIWKGRVCLGFFRLPLSCSCHDDAVSDTVSRGTSLPPTFTWSCAGSRLRSWYDHRWEKLLNDLHVFLAPCCWLTDKIKC